MIETFKQGEKVDFTVIELLSLHKPSVKTKQKKNHRLYRHMSKITVASIIELMECELMLTATPIYATPANRGRENPHKSMRQIFANKPIHARIATTTTAKYYVANHSIVSTVNTHSNRP